LRLSTARIIQILGIWGLLFIVLLTIDAAQSADPVSRAVLGMTWGLILLWVVLGGLLTLRFRESIRQRILKIDLNWRVKFVLMCIALALIEEAITTGMTNLAPFFGVRIGEAYITASANYLDVVLFHSVIVFVPMFFAWAWLLSRCDFSPNAVFLLFGLTGMLGEIISFGPQNLVLIGQWTYVYGLMIYLPAYSLPAERNARAPRFYHYPLAVIFPIICSIPVALVVGTIHPVGIHFPPTP
jgi:hypothetical protein